MDTQPSAQSDFKGFEGFGVNGRGGLGEAELRVLLYIIRLTFGFKKAADTISLRQMVQGIVRRDGTVLDRGTGLTKSGVTKALRGLLAKGIISARQNRSTEKGNEPTSYTLRFRTPLSTSVDKGVSTGEDKSLSTGVDTQDAVLQSNSSTMIDQDYEEGSSIGLQRTGSQVIAVDHSRIAIPAAAVVTGPSREESEVLPIARLVQQRVEELSRRW
jgi:hypothetical protein